MSPLEKCARAICAAEGEDPDRIDSWEGKVMWFGYVTSARACLESIREPDEETVEATKAAWGLKQYGRQNPHKLIITAAIDHILSQ